MKFAICLLACLVAVNGAPISITGNTIGDIYSVNININAKVENHVEDTAINAILALLNMQGVELPEELSSLIPSDAITKNSEDTESDTSATLAKALANLELPEDFKLPENFQMPKDLSFLKNLKFD